ncbi:MAG: TIGR00153 family protein [Chlamydiales bacterium]|nr:TIGR00153 family protein [Chlamydiales bacterium]
MLHILNLFARSPFAPLQRHMEKVAECVHMLEALFTAVIDTDNKRVHDIAKKISDVEHQADVMKSSIRNNLPSNLFLSIDRSTFLEILQLQDSIADKVEDIAVLLTIRPIELHAAIKELFERFLAKNIQCFEESRKIIQELHELLESSFGGSEAENVKDMCDEVAFLEHEADCIQRELLKSLYQSEDTISYGTFGLWNKIFEATGAISNISEKLADSIRMTLDIKTT